MSGLSLKLPMKTPSHQIKGAGLSLRARKKVLILWCGVEPTYANVHGNANVDHDFDGQPDQNADAVALPTTPAAVAAAVDE